MGQNKAELDILQQSQRELTLGKNKIESILTSLNKEKVNNLFTTNIFFLYSFMFRVNLLYFVLGWVGTKSSSVKRQRVRARNGSFQPIQRR